MTTDTWAQVAPSHEEERHRDMKPASSHFSRYYYYYYVHYVLVQEPYPVEGDARRISREERATLSRATPRDQIPTKLRHL